MDQVWILNVQDRQLEVTDALGTRVLRRGDGTAAVVEGVTVDLVALFADLEDES